MLSMTVNIPGPNKLTKDAKFIFDVMMDKISNLDLKILEIRKYSVASGYEAQIAVDEDAVKLKKIVVLIEETNILGRFMDIDVMNCDKKQICRKDIGMLPRKCFICDNDAKICARSAKHSLEELLSFMHKKVRQYDEN